jgi:ABC-type molybdate transport system substrate-binding protein
VGATVLAIVVAACGNGGGTPQAAPAPPPKPNGYITVVAADAVASVLEQEARAFQAENRLATVAIEPAPSSALATDLLGGKVADLFVAAGTADMDRVVEAGLSYGAALQFARDPSATPPLVFSVALMNTTGDRATSRAFMEFLTTPTAREILRAADLRPVS